MSNKRKYNKKSEYWNKFKQVQGAQSKEMPSLLDTLPETAGESFYTQEAIANSATVSTNRRVGYDGTTTSRRNIISKKPKSDKYTNIRNGLLPYDYSADGVNVRDAIELCQKAYANISIFRNAIDIMAEFSNSPIYLEGDNEKSKKFIDGWLKKINIWKIKDQYFREYYRSGNIFLYRVDGKFSSEDLLKLNYVYASQTLKSGQLPVKYMLLNPYDIVIEKATSFQDGIYKKVLSESDLFTLRRVLPRDRFQKWGLFKKKSIFDKSLIPSNKLKK